MGGFYMEFTHHEFLYGRKIDPDICDGLIEYFEEFPLGETKIPTPSDAKGTWMCLKREGRLAGVDGPNDAVDKQGKQSLDLGIPYYVSVKRIQIFNKELNKEL